MMWRQRIVTKDQCNTLYCHMIKVIRKLIKSFRGVPVIKAPCNFIIPNSKENYHSRQSLGCQWYPTLQSIPSYSCSSTLNLRSKFEEKNYINSKIMWWNKIKRMYKILPVCSELHVWMLSTDSTFPNKVSSKYFRVSSNYLQITFVSNVFEEGSVSTVPETHCSNIKMLSLFTSFQ